MPNGNQDKQALHDYIDRVVEIERTFKAAQEERKDMISEMKTEIKGRYDATGVESKEVMRLAKIKLNETESREQHAQLAEDLETIDLMAEFDGKIAAASGDDEEIDPLA